MSKSQAKLIVPFVIALLGAAFAPQGRPDIEIVDVFVAGSGGYHTFRIPALLVTSKGTLLAFCEGRKTSRNDHGDVDLVLRRSVDGGRTWAPLELVYEEGRTAQVTIGNPCPVVDRDTGAIWLPFCRNNSDVLLTWSSDDGKTWAQPRDITADVKLGSWGWYATGPGVGIQLRQGPSAGRLVIPCDHREEGDGGLVSKSHVFYSDDHGRTWKLGGSTAAHTNECQVVELSDGRLRLDMRNHREREGKLEGQGGARAVAWSRDGGKTWSEVALDEALVEPVCQASFIRYSDQGHPDRSRILFANPASRNRRVDLTVRLSYDEGSTWAVERLLQPGPAAYSSLAVLPDQAIGCLFENGSESAYEKISFARFTLEWMTKGNDRTPARPPRR